MSLPVTALTAAFLALLILITAILTVKQRFRTGDAFGNASDDGALTAATRSHGNLAEHAPMFVIMIALLELSNANHLGLMALCILFMSARLAHIIGLQMKHAAGKPPLPRSLGVIGTWISYAWAIGWIAYMIALGNL